MKKSGFKSLTENQRRHVASVVKSLRNVVQAANQLASEGYKVSQPTLAKIAKTLKVTRGRGRPAKFTADQVAKMVTVLKETKAAGQPAPKAIAKLASKGIKVSMPTLRKLTASVKLHIGRPDKAAAVKVKKTVKPKTAKVETPAAVAA